MVKKYWKKLVGLGIVVIAVAAVIIIKTTDKNGMEPENMVLEQNNKEADFSLYSTVAIDYAELTSFGLPVIVDYGADACIPCQQMAPVLKKANEDNVGKAFVKFINVWEHPEAMGEVPIGMIPTQIIFDWKGKPFQPSSRLMEELEFKYIYDEETGEIIFTKHVGAITQEQMDLILEELEA